MGSVFLGVSVGENGIMFCFLYIFFLLTVVKIIEASLGFRNKALLLWLGFTIGFIYQNLHFT